MNSQPRDEKETRKICLTRIEEIRKYYDDYDFYISIEGGINRTVDGGRIVIFVAISYKNNPPEVVKGCEIPIPRNWYDRLNKDKNIELGDIIDEYMGRKDLKRKQGAIGILTGNVLTRYDVLYHACCCALIPHKNKEIF